MNINALGQDIKMGKAGKGRGLGKNRPSAKSRIKSRRLQEQGIVQTSPKTYKVPDSWRMQLPVSLSVNGVRFTDNLVGLRKDSEFTRNFRTEEKVVWKQLPQKLKGLVQQKLEQKRQQELAMIEQNANAPLETALGNLAIEQGKKRRELLAKIESQRAQLLSVIEAEYRDTNGRLAKDKTLEGKDRVTAFAEAKKKYETAVSDANERADFAKQINGDETTRNHKLEQQLLIEKLLKEPPAKAKPTFDPQVFDKAHLLFEQIEGLAKKSHRGQLTPNGFFYQLRRTLGIQPTDLGMPSRINPFDYVMKPLELPGVIMSANGQPAVGNNEVLRTKILDEIANKVVINLVTQKNS